VWVNLNEQKWITFPSAEVLGANSLIDNGADNQGRLIDCG